MARPRTVIASCGTFRLIQYRFFFLTEISRNVICFFVLYQRDKYFCNKIICNKNIKIALGRNQFEINLSFLSI